MSRHVKGCVKPWEWGDVPLFWRDWVLISLEITNDLKKPTEKG